MLFIVSGPSGAGKSTLCAHLLDRFDELELSVSYTTRAPRGAERDGEAYHFVDVETFRSMIDGGAFVEWAEVHGNLYGTGRPAVDEVVRRGGSVLFDVDWQGAEALMAAYPEAVSVMVLPPDRATLEARLRARGTDDDSVIARRLTNAIGEMRHAPSFGYLVVNRGLDDARVDIEAIFRASTCATHSVWPAAAAALELDPAPRAGI